MGTHEKCFHEMLPLSTHNICLHAEIKIVIASLGGSIGCVSDWRPEGRWFDPCQGRQHSFAEFDHEIVPMVILSLQLIQEGQLSVSGERLCTILVNRLED